MWFTLVRQLLVMCTAQLSSDIASKILHGCNFETDLPHLAHSERRKINSFKFLMEAVSEMKNGGGNGC